MTPSPKKKKKNLLTKFPWKLKYPLIKNSNWTISKKKKKKTSNPNLTKINQNKPKKQISHIKQKKPLPGWDSRSSPIEETGGRKEPSPAPRRSPWSKLKFFWGKKLTRESRGGCSKRGYPSLNPNPESVA